MSDKHPLTLQAEEAHVAALLERREQIEKQLDEVTAELHAHGVHVSPWRIDDLRAMAPPKPETPTAEAPKQETPAAKPKPRATPKKKVV